MLLKSSQPDFVDPLYDAAAVTPPGKNVKSAEIVYGYNPVLCPGTHLHRKVTNECCQILISFQVPDPRAFIIGARDHAFAIA